MRWTSIALLLVALSACDVSERTQQSSTETRPSTDMRQIHPVTGSVYTPLYPNAPVCPDGTNGAYIVRMHSYWTHVPTTSTIRPEHTEEQRKFFVEVYSYTSTGVFCRNVWDLATFVIQDGPSPLVTFIDYQETPIRVVVGALGINGGPDRLIGSVGPRQTCCPVQATAGVRADTIMLYTAGF